MSREFQEEYFSLAAAFEILPLFLFPWNTKLFDCFLQKQDCRSVNFLIKA